MGREVGERGGVGEEVDARRDGRDDERREADAVGGEGAGNQLDDEGWRAVAAGVAEVVGVGVVVIGRAGGVNGVGRGGGPRGAVVGDVAGVGAVDEDGDGEARAAHADEGGRPARDELGEGRGARRARAADGPREVVRGRARARGHEEKNQIKDMIVTCHFYANGVTQSFIIGFIPGVCPH